jgi:enamine deaminase RidA (YjgF/YER057c/UK114 family)
MLPRRKFQPENLSSIGITSNTSPALAVGKMIFIGGQVDLDMEAVVTRPDNLTEQIKIILAKIEKLLFGLGCELSDLVKLTAFYVPHGPKDLDVLLESIGAEIDDDSGIGPSIMVVPLKALPFPGMKVKIEAIAMRGENGEKLARSIAWIPDGNIPKPFSHAIRCGEMIFTSGMSAMKKNGSYVYPGSLAAQSRVVLDKLNRLLRQLGADLHDAVKANIFNVEPGKMEDWKEGALIRASYYPEPGPAATGISIPCLEHEEAMIRNDVIAMRGIDGSRLHRQAVWPTGHWDWPVHMPYRHGLKVGDMIFFGGQVSLTTKSEVISPGDMKAQTHQAMKYIDRVLGEFKMSIDHLVKINAFYVGKGGANELHENASARMEYYQEHGPTSTGVPVPYLAYENMLIEIDGIAMV